MPTELTPAQKKQASYPVICAKHESRLRKSGTTHCASFACCMGYGLRVMSRTCPIAGCSRHSSSTPSPTMPVAPVRITLIDSGLRAEFIVAATGAFILVGRVSDGPQTQKDAES